MKNQSNEQLVEQFRQWLDENEAASVIGSSDVAAYAATDLFSLYTELAALKSEVRLESRQFKSALEKFSSVFDTLEHSHEKQSKVLEKLRLAHSQQKVETENALLLEIIDLRDRLGVGCDSAQGYKVSGLARLCSAPAAYIRSLADGMSITLRRLDDVLARYQVQAVLAIGQPLDPNTMQVHSVEYHSNLADGTVVSELRKGYIRHGERLRLAEVIVNKHN